MVYLAIHDRVMGFKNVWPMHLICFQILLIFTFLQSKSKSETRVLEAHKHQHNTRILIIQISQSRVSASLLLSSASKTKRSSLSLTIFWIRKPWNHPAQTITWWEPENLTTSFDPFPTEKNTNNNTTAPNPLPAMVPVPGNFLFLPPNSVLLPSKKNSRIRTLRYPA